MSKPAYKKCEFKSRKKHRIGYKDHCCVCGAEGQMYAPGICETCAEPVLTPTTPEGVVFQHINRFLQGK